MISKTLYVYINICAKHKLLYLSPFDMPSPLSNACCGRSFSFRFFFLLTLALRTKSMALGATVLASVLIEITGAIVRTSPTLRLVHVTFEPFLPPPPFFRFQ